LHDNVVVVASIIIIIIDERRHEKLFWLYQKANIKVMKGGDIYSVGWFLPLLPNHHRNFVHHKPTR